MSSMSRMKWYGFSIGFAVVVFLLWAPRASADANLSLDVRWEPASPRAGEPVAFFIRVSNSGPDTACEPYVSLRADENPDPAREPNGRTQHCFDSNPSLPSCHDDW